MILLDDPTVYASTPSADDIVLEKRLSSERARRLSCLERDNITSSLVGFAPAQIDGSGGGGRRWHVSAIDEVQRVIVHAVEAA